MSFGRAAPAGNSARFSSCFAFAFSSSRHVVDALRTACRGRRMLVLPDDSARAATRHCSMLALSACVAIVERLMPAVCA